MTSIKMIKSINMPISSIFKIVPKPICSPKILTTIIMINPTNIETTPMLNPIVFAIPAWKTSHGANPTLALIVITMPSAYRKSPIIKLSRRIKKFLVKFKTVPCALSCLFYTSKLLTNSAFSSMNSRRGATTSPIRVVKMRSASTASYMCTWMMLRRAGSMVVSQS